ncbi:hypothetical protein [Streptomyces sp. NPDC058657]|uniref:hypothetical protein n=1 Tax=unclassified Streptomyces TaxID=2593676 RepID=UPI0036694C80
METSDTWESRRAPGENPPPTSGPAPTVAKFLLKHEEFADLTHEVTPAIRHWLKAALAH